MFIPAARNLPIISTLLVFGPAVNIEVISIGQTNCGNDACAAVVAGGNMFNIELEAMLSMLSHKFRISRSREPVTT